MRCWGNFYTIQSAKRFTVAVTGNITNTDPNLVSVVSAVLDSSPSIPEAHLTAGSPAIKAA